MDNYDPPYCEPYLVLLFKKFKEQFNDKAHGCYFFVNDLDHTEVTVTIYGHKYPEGVEYYIQAKDNKWSIIGTNVLGSSEKNIYIDDQVFGVASGEFSPN